MTKGRDTTYEERISFVKECIENGYNYTEISEKYKVGYSETYQALYHEKLLQTIEARPWLWATHLWNMFDFGVAARNEGGTPGQNQKGLVTMDRLIRKDAYYLYRAYWSDQPFVHLCGRRYVERTEAVTQVKVYSNQPEVTLYVNGVKYKTLAATRIFCFELPLEGEVELTATAGECSDSITIRRVSEPNKTYKLENSGGVVNWFDQESFKANGDANELQSAINAAQEAAEVPFLVSANLESGGDGIADNGTYMGRQMLIAATNDEQQAWRLGRLCGLEGAAVGVNWAFSPVLNPNVTDIPYLKEVFRHRTNERIAAASEGVQELAQKYDAQFLNLNEGLADADGNLKAEFTIEGMHMYADGYRVVLRNLLPVLKQISKSQRIL